MKILSGTELAGYEKEKQAHEVRQVVSAKHRRPKLVIIRDSENPVIMKYVGLKKQYGEDIGVEVEESAASGKAKLVEAIEKANNDASVAGIIVQLPLAGVGAEELDEVLAKIAPEKDVDGLRPEMDGKFDSATATAINWLLAGYGIELGAPKKVAIVGRGRLVGKPLYKMFKNSGVEVEIFHRGDELEKLENYDVVVTATGSPRIIKSEYIRAGAVVVDAGTASEDGVLVGDVEEAVRERDDLAAITPKIGGVGPLTVAALFDHVIRATK